MSKIIDLNWLDRQKIREQMRISMLSRYDFTPVLLMYWTSQSLSQFLIPVNKEELDVLKLIHGIDENSEGWELHRPIFNWLKNKLSYTYEDADEEQQKQGEWREKYFMDTHDEQGKVITPVTLPPGTVVVITGMVI